MTFTKDTPAPKRPKILKRTILIRLPIRLHAALELAAKNRFLSKSAFLNGALAQLLRRELNFLDYEEQERARLPPEPPPFTPEEQACYEKDCAYLESVGQGRPMNRFDFWRLEIEQLTKKRSPGRPRTIR